jgi:hypothetical protein
MSTAINDLVCVHIEKKPAFYARIENIEPDKKQGWWQVRLLVLTHPLQVFTWILEERQICGEPFTMGGTPVFLEKVVSPIERINLTGSSLTENESTENAARKEPAKIVSLLDRKKEK